MPLLAKSLSFSFLWRQRQRSYKAFIFIAAVSAVSVFADFSLAQSSSSTKTKPMANDFVELGGDDDSDSTNPSESSASERSLGTKSQRSPAAAAAADNEKTVSGTVRVMRKIGQTEVFFKDLNESYFIPSGNNYSSIFNAFTESQKKGNSVSFTVNTKSRRVLNVNDGSETASSVSGENSRGPASSSGASGSK